MELSEHVKAAARWWREAGEGAGRKNNNGDFFQEALADMLKSKMPETPPMKEEWNRFEKILGEKMQTEVDRMKKAHPDRERWHSVTNSVDYGPDQMIFDSAIEAGLPEDRIGSFIFPIKSVTWATSCCAWAARGYRAPRVLISGSCTENH